MLHHINLAADAELRNVLAFQRIVLRFALLPRLSVPLLRAEANTHFGARADWFWRHTSLHQPLTALNAVVRNNATLSARVLNAFDNDVGFDNQINNSRFAFACNTLPPQVGGPLRILLETFYDIFSSAGGYSNEISGNGVLTRNTWVRTFWELNPNLRVCPTCDGPRPDRIEEKIYAQCDHHFPRSKHCALSIHPQNLRPCCTPCNEDFKEDRDATDYATLAQMFLPYAREAFGPLHVRTTRDPQTGLKLVLEDGGADTPRVRSLNYILRLQDRWTTRLQDQIAPSIENNVRHQRNLIQRLGGNATNLLEDLAAQRLAARNARGRESNAIIAEAYWTFLENDPHERAAILV